MTGEVTSRVLDGGVGTAILNPPVPNVPKLSLGTTMSNIATLAYRNSLKFYRNRQLLLLSVVQPLTNMMMFAYVFNNVAKVPGLSYREFVIPGVLIQAVMVTAMRTGVSVSYDADSGMNDRFRSLPIARSAVLIGRTLSDTARIGLQTVVLVIVATTIVGFEFREGPLRAVGAVAVIVIFGLAVTTFSAWVGLIASDPETAQTLLITPVLPLVFGSSGFAPVSSLPSWIRVFATINPVTSAVDLSRSLAVGGPLRTPFEHYVLWTGGLVVVFTYLGVQRYQRG
ncbi:ABC transporter permease [Jatrophihabitans sp. DSM 45814]